MRRIRNFLAALAVFALITASCGSDDTNTAAEGVADSDTTEEFEAEDSEPAVEAEDSEPADDAGDESEEAMEDDDPEPEAPEVEDDGQVCPIAQRS